MVLPFFAETQHTLGDVLDIHLVVGGGHNVVAVEILVALSRGLEFISGIEADAAEGGLMRVAVLIIESVGKEQIPFGPLVTETIGGIAFNEIAGAQLGLTHATQTQTPALLMIVTEDIEYRSNVELAVAALLGGGDITAGEHLAGVFDSAELGQATQFNPHTVEHRLLGRKLHWAPLVELALVVHQVLLWQDNFVLEGRENTVGQHFSRVAEVIVGVDTHLVYVEFLYTLRDVHTSIGVATIGQPMDASIGSGIAPKCLYNREVSHKIEVHVGRYGHHIFRQGKGTIGVERDIHASGEAVALLIGRYKAQFHTFLSLDQAGVGDIELIKGGAQD